MAFFALVLEPDEPVYEIKDCHINLWSLRGVGRSVLFLDVGLLLKTEQAVARLHVAIPFGTADKALSDLSRHILNPTIAELIFGNPITFDMAKPSVDYGSGEARVQPISTNDATRVATKSGRTHSYWTLILPQPSASEDVYVRFRFDVSSVGREWNRRSSLLSHESLLIDFRVADVREASGVTGWDVLKNAIVPIQQLYVFVVVPARMELQATSPSLRYMRLLESDAWEVYLSRRTSRGRRSKFLVYYWRHPPPERPAPVDQRQPFRGFLSLRAAATITPNAFSFWLAMLLTVLAALWFGDRLKEIASATAATLADNILIWLAITTATLASGAVLGTALAYIGLIKWLRTCLRASLKALDTFWYGA